MYELPNFIYRTSMLWTVSGQAMLFYLHDINNGEASR
jgi:hypothetical protein